MTQRITPVRLNTAEFKSGLGEIVDLVSQACEKTNPKVIAHIEKFSKKAQDEIYGRFNETFNGGVKDPAKGRKFLEENLDFRSLTEKVTEVAEDIELAGEINELFNKNAPTQGPYKKLSLAARKEIEKHLAIMTPQNALIKVFGGMGRLERETSMKEVSEALALVVYSSTTPKAEPGQPVSTLEAKTSTEKRILSLSHAYANDFTTLKKAEQYLKTTCPEASFDQQKASVLKLFKDLSPYAQLLIEQTLIQMNVIEYIPLSYDKKAAMTMNDTVLFFMEHRSIYYKPSPDVIKKAMLDVLESFNQERSQFDIIMKLSLAFRTPRISSHEELLLNQYLSFVRTVTHFSLKGEGALSTAQLDEFILRVIRQNLAPSLMQDFHTLEAQEKMITSNTQGRFTKRDFYDQVTPLL